MEPKFTPQERYTLKRIFELALPLIETKEEDFICHALIEVGRCGIGMTHLAAQAQKMISARLGENYSTYSSWLMDHHSPLYANWHRENHDLLNRDCGFCRAGRIVWLKALVEEFSS